MKRGSKAGGKAVKAGRRKAPTPRRAIPPKSVPPRPSAATGEETETERLTRERDDALEREKATAEVLRVISSSPGNLQTVFQAILEKATRLCEAKFGTLFRFDGKLFHLAAQFGTPRELAELQRRRGPFEAKSGNSTAPLERLARTKQVVHFADEAAEAAPGTAVTLGGARSTVRVPLLKDSVLIGALIIYRQEVRPFTEKQIELVQNFAAQAVIAIENTRLLNELRESLEQQTATSEVLRVVSTSPGDMKPVFGAMLEKALRICETKFGHILLYDGERYHASHLHDVPPSYRQFWEKHGPIRPGPNTGLARLVDTKQVAHIPDLKADTVYASEREPLRVVTVEEAGARTLLAVPMVKEDRLIGAIIIYRQEVRPFTDKQIELVKNFAAQAVIAIENTRLLSELRQRTNDLTESLEQQTATSEVLKVISSSPGELEPVFQAMLRNATRICEANFGNLVLYDGEVFRRVALHNAPAAWAADQQRDSRRTRAQAPLLYRLLDTKEPVHFADVAAEVPGDTIHKYTGARSLLLVPMLKDNELVGGIGIYRQEVRPFSGKQVALLKNFAAQAVIAIENARLLSELRESLQQQTATSEVLRVISSSPGELEPVFQAMLENATRICEARFGVLHRFDGKTLLLAAEVGTPAAYAEFLKKRGPFLPQEGSQLDRAMKTKQASYTADMAAETIAGSPARLGGARSVVAVPMLKDDNLVGAIIIYRQEVRPFTDKQVELLKNFAAQAVIAIENARLLNELRQRTDALTESLEQQTATAEVLRAIAGSPSDIEPVLEVIVRTAGELCESEYAILWRLGADGKYHMGSSNKADPEWVTYWSEHPINVDRGSLLGRTVIERRAVHILDCLSDPEYRRQEAARLGRQRSMLGVPLLREGVPIGAIVLLRTEVKAFTEKQIALVENFAAQAVIAIENARLLSELRQRTADLSEALEQQTATSDVLAVINSSSGDLAPVFDTLLEKAMRLCHAAFGGLWIKDGNEFHAAALKGVPEAFAHFHNRPINPQPGSLAYVIVGGADMLHIPDMREDDGYRSGYPAKRALVDEGGARSVLVVALRSEERLLGFFLIYRREVGPFADNQIALLQNFASQAVIAIENTRLLNELRQRTTDLSNSLEDLRTAQDRLVQTQKLASLGQLTAGIAHEIKNPLNFVNNFSGVSVELIDELQETLGRVTADKKTREEIAELADTLRDNLDKIVQHGKRADSIVKNMLLHSREGSGERRSVDVNALVEESLNLAYHGARAEKQGFNVSLERSFDPSAGEVDAYPQEITRVLLNLIANGFYAATKRQGQEGGNGFEPTISAATKSLGDRVEIRIRDNGIGIPPEVREKMFNPFFTTKPAGEGTGLGLSISHDIIVKQHSGSIEVDTKPGAFTEFRIILPRTAA